MLARNDEKMLPQLFSRRNVGKLYHLHKSNNDANINIYIEKSVGKGYR